MRSACSHTASLVEGRNHAVQGIVLAKEEKVMLAAEVVVEICRREGSGGGDVAHAGFRKPAHAELPPCCAQDFQAPRKIAPPDMFIALIGCPAV